MGGADFFCSVSGARFFYTPEEFRDEIVQSDDTYEEDDMMNFLNQQKVVVSRTLKAGLCYTKEDVESSSKFVMISQYDTLENGTIVLHTDMDYLGSFLISFSMISLNISNETYDYHDLDESTDPPNYTEPTEYTESNIIEVFNVIPGDDPDLGSYVNEDANEPNRDYTLLGRAGMTPIIAYTSFLILKQAAPRVKPHVVYALLLRGPDQDTKGQIVGIDYGPVNLISGQYVNFLAICGEDDYKESRAVWKQLLTQEGKSDEEILHDAWRGPGNMWVFVRPDRFPIVETLGAESLPIFVWSRKLGENTNEAPTFWTLPIDVLLAICSSLPVRSIYALTTTCKRIRVGILPHVDLIAHRRLIEDEPWYLPAGPFDLRDKTHGREEVDWWNAEWARGGISGDDMDTKIPWFLYRRQCSESLSMWNRKRIWGVATQLEKLASERGFL